MKKFNYFRDETTFLMENQKENGGSRSVLPTRTFAVLPSNALVADADKKFFAVLFPLLIQLQVLSRNGW